MLLKVCTIIGQLTRSPAGHTVEFLTNKYFRQKKHTDKFNIRFFRVLTVTSSAARLQNLVAAAEAAEDVRVLGRMFLFTTEEKLPLARPAGTFEKIWTLPGASKRVSLSGG